MQGCNQKISLCMIVKNGAEYLQQCLASVQSVVSEIIVVDTGSTDNSVRIAKEFGAIVDFQQWQDDFSYARNKSLALATGDWILSLDADEELASGSLPLLKKLIQTSTFDAFYVNIISTQMNNGHKTDFINMLPRLFRNHQEIRYQGRIHEQILPSLEKLNFRVGFSDLEIIHHGYSIGKEKQDEKLVRNEKLLLKELNDNSENAFAAFHLGETYSLLNQPEKASSYYHKALKMQTLPDHLKSVAYQNYGNTLLQMREFDEAINQCNKAIQIQSDLLMAHLIAGIAYMKLSQPFNAILKLERLLDHFVQKQQSASPIFEAIPDLTYVYTVLGHNYIQLNKIEKAIAYYQKAIENGSRFNDSYLGLADILFDRRHYALALKYYQVAYKLGYRDHSIYLQLMKCYFEIGNYEKAQEMIQPLIINRISFQVENKYERIVSLAKRNQ